MGFFEKEIARAVVLALFIPLIISQRRQLRLAGDDAGHPRHGARRGKLRDWWRVVRREIVAGLGARARSSAAIGFSRIVVWAGAVPHLRRRTTCSSRSPSAFSLVGVVMLGTHRRLDAAVRPAAARASTPPAPRRRSSPRSSTSAGLVIYFTVAAIILRGTLL